MALQNKRLNVICGAALMLPVLLLPTAPACAQKRGEKEPPPRSFSSKPNSGKPAPKTVYAPVGEQEVADAIMGDALNEIYSQADKHFEKGEYEHCINLYKIVEQGDPHNVEAFAGAAYLLWSTDRNDQAIAQLKLGVAANPDDAYMYNELGMHYWYHLKDAQSAIPWFEKAIKYRTGWTTYHSLAFCYQKLGEWDKAVAMWREATKYGDDPRAQSLLKQAEAHLK